MTTVPTFALTSSVEIPAIGFGVFQTPPDETRSAVEAALSAGYRHIDTAAAYGNEREVGEAIAKSGVDQIDLLILHQALPSEFDRTREAYRALQTLLDDGRVRAVGVSNFMVEHLTALLDKATVVLAVNQIEVHPYFTQREVQAFGARHGILSQAWSPIGGITFYRDSGHSNALKDPVIGAIAEAHGKSPAQVMLRWHMQQGRSAIPKSTRPARIAENLDVFDFELTGEQLAAIDALDTGRRGGPEPEAVTLETFSREIPEA